MPPAGDSRHVGRPRRGSLLHERVAHIDLGYRTVRPRAFALTQYLRPKRDGHITHGAERARQRKQDRVEMASRFTFAHRYVDGKLALHLHIWGVRNRRDYCVVLERSESDLQLTGTALLGHDEFTALVPTTGAHYEIVARAANEVQQSVTVDAREVMQEAESPPEVCSVVRLHRLNDCLSLLRQRRDLEQAAVRRGLAAPVLCEVVIPLVVDREGGRTDCVVSGKPPREVVQRGARVLEHVSDDNRDVGREFLDDLHAVLGAFRFCLTDEQIRLTFEEGGDLVFERFEVLARAKEFYEEPFFDHSNILFGHGT